MIWSCFCVDAQLWGLSAWRRGSGLCVCVWWVEGWRRVIGLSDIKRAQMQLRLRPDVHLVPTLQHSPHPAAISVCTGSSYRYVYFRMRRHYDVITARYLPASPPAMYPSSSRPPSLSFNLALSLALFFASSLAAKFLFIPFHPLPALPIPLSFTLALSNLSFFSSPSHAFFIHLSHPINFSYSVTLSRSVLGALTLSLGHSLSFPFTLSITLPHPISFILALSNLCVSLSSIFSPI